ncbi:CoA ester lyase [Acrocarpospora macrocephala]|uniref:CoA ester lyase n=1 Tax=Acrocarpospora macrocephala TaxID=150177 RepID=A0A5M3X2L6_9ACTN|nr:CoA ester lyase [Acrocarpospora macrocephala]GES13841.1 CoA ester lyase [Acrocarpospora macrocephala]
MTTPERTAPGRTTSARTTPGLVRSALYVPGDQPGKLAGAATRGADSLIVDLEDAVPAAAKPQARATVARWLASDGPAVARETQLWIRINPGEAGLADLAEVAHPAVTGICVAKTESVDWLAELDRKLADYPHLVLCPILESAAAVLSAPRLAKAPRVARLQLGEADLRADLGVDPGDDERELLWARSHVVLASAAAGLAPPLAPVSTAITDPDALRRSTHALRRLGFHGRACIHPAQIPIVHEVFTPTPGELSRAQALITRFENTPDGVLVDDDGRMVDEAVIRQARRTLSMS